MQSPKRTLKDKLKNAKKIALVAIGSQLRADDAAGLFVGKELQKFHKGINRYIKFKIFFGETAPENLTGEIKRFNPTHIIIVDSSDLGKKAGTTMLIEPKEVGGFSFCTHQLPMKIMADYLMQSINCQVLIIGIQPKTLEFGARPSKEIERSTRLVAEMLREVLMKKGG